MKPTDGSTDESPFETVADVEISRRERTRQQYDERIRAPFAVAWSDWRARVGLGILAFYTLMGTLGVLLVDVPTINEGPRLLPPFQDPAYPLGTDMLGHDLLEMIVHATPAMLLMVLSGGVFTIVMATAVGTTAGYKGGLVDQVLVTVLDTVMNIPGFPLIIIISVIYEPRSPLTVGVILSINAWAGLARAVRSEVLTLREESYVEASRAMGISTPTILLKDVVPNLMPYIMVNFVGAGRAVIFGSVALYFLGILPFSNLNWGVMLNGAYNNGALYTWQAFHWLAIPMVAIGLLSFGLILFAQGTDRIFNPRVRARHTADSTDAGQDDADQPSTRAIEGGL